MPDDANTIRIGNGLQRRTFISGISSVTVPNGVPVVINSDGQLGVMTSSAHYKEAIQPMAKSSEALLALRPVTFRYKKELDPAAIPQCGLVAEEVAKVDPDLVARDEKGKPYTVRYEAVNAMLLNEFLKEHRKVEELEKAMAKLQATIEKVSAQVAAEHSAPRVVLDGRLSAGGHRAVGASQGERTPLAARGSDGALPSKGFFLVRNVPV